LWNGKVQRTLKVLQETIYIYTNNAEDIQYFASVLVKTEDFVKIPHNFEAIFTKPKLNYS